MISGVKIVDQRWDVSLAIRIWPVLVNAARRRRKLTYGDIGDRVGVDPRSVGAGLYPIQEFCRKNELPKLTGLVVLQATGLPSHGFRTAGQSLADIYTDIFEYRWDSVAPPKSEDLEQP